MGQYHTVVAMLADDVDDVATIDRERLGAGAKLSEQSYTWDPDVRPAVGSRPPTAPRSD